MLEDLIAERLKGFNHNLVVAATGTGKTVIAALAYKRLCEAAGRDLKLLFVAHRQEILKQAVRTYRDVMQDGAIGELYVGEHKPRQWKHIFASVQSLSSLGTERLAPDFFDVFASMNSTTPWHRPTVGCWITCSRSSSSD